MASIKKYNGSSFENAAIRKYSTASEIITPTTTIYTDGTAITSYTIKGNTVQDGTPTPSNPVSVNGVGVRTENLYDKTNIITLTIGNRYGTYLPTDTYSIYNDTDNIVYWFANNGSTIIEACQPHSTSTVTLYGNTTGFYMPYNSESLGDVTIVQGSTAPDHYIPYGYKIPVLANQQTTNIYLGNVQSTRPIRKLVFTGNENFTKVSGYNYIYIYSLTYLYKAKSTDLLCTHLTKTAGLPVNGGFCISSDLSTSYLNFGAAVMDVQPSGDTVEGLKEYLTSQYANGTPVTVYYPLQNNLVPTATVNEPLMKIGDYADTFSNATAIPTTEGANSITVDITVQPSEFTATWTGWHDSSVKEWDGSQWNE